MNREYEHVSINKKTYLVEKTIEELNGWITAGTRFYEEVGFCGQLIKLSQSLASKAKEKDE